MKRLSIFLLVLSLFGCDKPHPLGNCTPYRGTDTPFTVVGELDLGDTYESVVKYNLLDLATLSLFGDAPSGNLRAEADGLFLEDVKAHYTLYFDSVSDLKAVCIVPIFDAADTAYAAGVFSRVMQYSRQNFGEPSEKRGASGTYAVRRFSWEVCDGLQEVLEYGVSHEWADTATRTIKMLFYK